MSFRRYVRHVLRYQRFWLGWIWQAITDLVFTAPVAIVGAILLAVAWLAWWAVTHHVITFP